MMQNYNIFGKLQEFLDDFDHNQIVIANNKNREEARYLSRRGNGYVFSQKDLLIKIDLAMNSVFDTGRTDSEGQRKVYLNTVRFIRDVTRMKTDIDIKNYVFHPDGHDDYWPVYLASRRFKTWARENNYGELLNRLGDDYCTYGTAVLKNVGKEIKRTPIRSLRNTQDAESLKKAVANGGYVIEQHDMTKTEMEDTMPDWQVKDLDYGKKYRIMELYTLVPRKEINRLNDNRSTVRDEEKMVQCQAILIPDLSVNKTNKEASGKVLFVEEITEAPYEEAHFDKIDGRWLGRGPVENQLENQIAQNMTANLRRRALLHSSKRIYQTNSDEVSKNLIRDVKDGQVLYVGTNGNITAVANEARNLAEFQSDENLWQKNAQQSSFTYEVATGESLPSGTPFRLGVLLSQAVDSYFGLKREVFGLFLKRSFFNQIIPIFQKETTAEHTLAFMGNEMGITNLKSALIEHKTNELATEELLKQIGQPGMPNVDMDVIRNQVTEQINKSPYLWVDVEKGLYKDLKYHMELDITDEATDPADIESLTNLYTSMTQAQDPRAESVLQEIFASRGKNLDVIAGKKELPQQPQQTTVGSPIVSPVNTQENANTIG